MLENSNEQYTDHGGTDLLSFFKETLNKNIKDRQILLKIEKDLIEFLQDGRRYILLIKRTLLMLRRRYLIDKNVNFI